MPRKHICVLQVFTHILRREKSLLADLTQSSGRGCKQSCVNGENKFWVHFANFSLPVKPALRHCFGVFIKMASAEEQDHWHLLSKPSYYKNTKNNNYRHPTTRRSWNFHNIKVDFVYNEDKACAVCIVKTLYGLFDKGRSSYSVTRANREPKSTSSHESTSVNYESNIFFLSRKTIDCTK